MRRAIAAKPDLRTPRLELAQLLANRGAYEEAETALSELLDLDPGNAEAQHALAVVRELRR
jgi:Flp pilus assembly protein TadD